MVIEYGERGKGRVSRMITMFLTRVFGQLFTKIGNLEEAG